MYDETGSTRLGQSTIYEHIGYTAYIPIHICEQGGGVEDNLCDGYGVHGKVLNSLGHPVAGVKVRALHLYFSDTLTDDNHHFAEKPLGEGESDPFGAYMISYDLEDIEGGDCECCTPADRANLIIEA